MLRKIYKYQNHKDVDAFLVAFPVDLTKNSKNTIIPKCKNYMKNKTKNKSKFLKSITKFNKTGISVSKFQRKVNFIFKIFFQSKGVIFKTLQSKANAPQRTPNLLLFLLVLLFNILH
jgi:hypothetical protein